MYGLHSAFADKKRKHDGKGGYKKTQAVSQVNDCGNGDTPIDVSCQNLASQIQGDGNTVALEGEQGEEENGDLTGQPDKNS
jgi:hypothetical protein